MTPSRSLALALCQQSCVLNRSLALTPQKASMPSTHWISLCRPVWSVVSRLSWQKRLIAMSRLDTVVGLLQRKAVKCGEALLTGLGYTRRYERSRHEIDTP